jgi:hypothetical protein
MNKRFAVAFGPVVAALLWCAAPAVADEHGMAAAEGDPLGEAWWVIKVTSTLTYLDIGSQAGAEVGQPFVILREQEGLYADVARVRILRVFDGFSIAETEGVVEGESIGVLQRAVAADLWTAAAADLDAGDMVPEGQRPRGDSPHRRSVTLLGGYAGGDGMDLRYIGGQPAGAASAGGPSVGLRLARSFSHWRLALTYRIAGEPMGGDADVTQLSMEVDSHYLLRGAGRAGPYIGLGVGMHQLAWDSAANLDDTAYKVGGQGSVGLDLPLGNGAWSFVLEGTWQKVMDWNSTVDVSGLRFHGGLSARF